jgi:glutathione-independent formaldehyde dehydrogenase
MQALVYNGPRDVSVKNVPDAKLERPTDVLVKITTTNICGSDPHMYEGRTDMEVWRVLGHDTAKHPGWLGGDRPAVQALVP